MNKLKLIFLPLLGSFIVILISLLGEYLFGIPFETIILYWLLMSACAHEYRLNCKP